VICTVRFLILVGELHVRAGQWGLGRLQNALTKGQEMHDSFQVRLGHFNKTRVQCHVRKISYVRFEWLIWPQLKLYFRNMYMWSLYCIGQRKLHNRELHNVHSLKNIFAYLNSRAVWGKYWLRSLECWDRRFESCSGHGCVSAFLCVVLSCVGRGLASGRSPVQGVLPIV
jgi:hypothetical protein